MKTHKATSCPPVFFSRVFWQSCVFTFHSSDIPFLKPLPGKDKEGKCSEICDSLHRVGWSLIIFRGGQNINIFHIYNWTPAVEVKLDRWDSGQGPNWHFGAVHWPVTMSKHHIGHICLSLLIWETRAQRTMILRRAGLFTVQWPCQSTTWPIHPHDHQHGIYKQM